MSDKKKQKGLPKRTGKRDAKIKVYYLSRYLEKKVRNILKNSGIEAAERWAIEHGANRAFLKVTRKGD
jgi:hypothetical protein